MFLQKRVSVSSARHNSRELREAKLLPFFYCYYFIKKKKEIKL